MWKRLVLAVALGLGVGGGCQYFNPVGPAIQLGIYWVNGEAHKYYNTDQASTLTAVRESLKELDIPINGEETADDGTVTIRAGGTTFVSKDTGPRRLGFKEERVELKGGEDRFKIKIIPVKPKTTKVSIRANVFGDKAYCEMIYRHIDGKAGIKQFVTVQELQAASSR